MVKFKETTTSNTWVPFKGEVEFTYKVYTGSTKQEAIEFLERQEVNEPSLYVIVETPEGNWGRDIAGIYDESADALTHSEQVRESEWSKQHQGQGPGGWEVFTKDENGDWQLDTVLLKAGRNDHCPCGSGKKFKHCCMA
jgi:uncharacterized protein YecA (UPF0149 family)